jgi:hypothetical protein
MGRAEDSNCSRLCSQSNIIAIEKPVKITYTHLSSSSEPECLRSKWIFDIA